MLTLNGFRILKGAAAAVMFANAMPLLAKTFSGQRRAMAIALWAGVVGICATASPVIGGVLINYAGWGWMNVATNAVPLARVGMVTGLVNSFYPIGASLGTVLMGIVFSARVDAAQPTLASMGTAVGLIYGFVAALSVVGAVIAATLVAHRIDHEEGGRERSRGCTGRRRPAT